MFKLKANAEELKMILSTMERAHCSIDALYDGTDFDHYLTRQRFESGCGKLYQQILQPIDDFLQANKLTEGQIDKVILAGAATKMCRLQALISQKFGESKLLNYQSPDEIISIGCAKQCALITNSKHQKTVDQDSFFKCLSRPIFYKVLKETLHLYSQCFFVLNMMLQFKGR
jgi:molecular chaperone DnaK (HSP70)